MVASAIDSLIPIPEVRTYALAVVAVCGVSCTALSAHLHARWLGARRIDFMVAHSAVLLLVVATSVLVLGWRAVVGQSSWTLLWLSPLGVLGGWAAVRSDRAIVRRHARRRDRQRSGAPGAQGLARLNPQVRSVKGVFGRKQVGARVVGAERMQERWDPMPGGLRLRLPWLLAVALLEELVFRGALFGLLRAWSSTGALALGVLGVGLAFCLSHVFFGWVHVLAKAPLCVVTTALSLTAGGPLLAVVAHVYFNFMVWRDTANAVVLIPNREAHLQPFA